MATLDNGHMNNVHLFHMNNGHFRYFVIKHHKEKIICNSQGLMKIKSHFNHFKFHTKYMLRFSRKWLHIYVIYSILQHILNH